MASTTGRAARSVAQRGDVAGAIPDQRHRPIGEAGGEDLAADPSVPAFAGIDFDGADLGVDPVGPVGVLADRDAEFGVGVAVGDRGACRQRDSLSLAVEQAFRGGENRCRTGIAQVDLLLEEV
jgi:hypothetical protein